MSKKVVDAKQDSKGNTSAVKLSGNKSFTSVGVAIKMADRGEIDNAHTVRPSNGAKPYLRTNPDSQKGNNLDEMAKS